MSIYHLSEALLKHAFCVMWCACIVVVIMSAYLVNVVIKYIPV